jgi:hypothetical protein
MNNQNVLTSQQLLQAKNIIKCEISTPQNYKPDIQNSQQNNPSLV